jgi:hypothetical protein
MVDVIQEGEPVTDPIIFADFELATGSGPHPETGEPVVMGLLRVSHNGQVVTCVLCKEMIEQMGKGFLEILPEITFSSEIVNEVGKKQSVN